MVLKAIIFDFDGVIVESMSIKTDAFIYLFKDYSKEIIDKIVRLHLDNGGMSRFEKFRIIYDQYIHEELTEKDEKRLGDEFSKYCYHKMITCPYVKGIEKFLKNNAEKYLFFIVSGTPHNEMNAIVDERGLRKYFKEVFGSPESKETLIKKILRNYNFRKNETVFIGDAPNDYIGAKKADIPFIARIPSNEYNPFESDEFEIRYQITDFNHFEEILHQINELQIKRVELR